MAISNFRAFPPEVHSALLRMGPGAGPLLAAAAALSGLAAEYAAAKDELIGALANSTATWEGASAERYRVAHLPFLDWLDESAATSEQTAAAHMALAGAYSAALAAMPTLAELAANHAIHAALTATNFLGINTIPIAMNEADYARLWMQAAITMETYEAVSNATLATMPHGTPAPTIMSTRANGLGRVASSSAHTSALSHAVRARSLMDGSDSNSDQDPLQQLEHILPKELQDLINRIRNDMSTLLAAPLAALLAFVAYEALSGVAGGTFYSAMIAAPFLALLAGAAPPPDPSQQPEEDPAPGSEKHDLDEPMNRRQRIPEHSMNLASAASSAPTSPSSSAPTSPSSPPSPASSPGASPVQTASGWYAFAVDDEEPPGARFGPTSRTEATAAFSSSNPAVAAAAARDQNAALARRKQSARSRKRNKVVLEEGERMSSDGFMDYEPPSAEPSASGSGAGPLGVAGVAQAQKTKSAGFATLSEGRFHTGPTVPLLPQTWTESDEEKP